MDDGALPLRILYKGASTVMWQSSTDRRPPTLMPYPRVVEQELRRGGRDVDTSVGAMSAVRATSILRDWEHEATSTAPDVVVLHYGHMETIHAVIPRWVERHARAGRERPGPVRDRYRAHVVRPVWKALALTQQRIDRALPRRLADRIARRRAQKVVALLEQYVARVGRLTTPLVVVMGLMEAGDVWKDWFPGIAERMPAMDAALRDMVRRADSPRIVFLDLWDEAASWDEREENPRPDGGHYSPEFHQLVGSRLAAVIEEWARTQQHLG